MRSNTVYEDRNVYNTYLMIEKLPTAQLTLRCSINYYNKINAGLKSNNVQCAWPIGMN